MKNEKGVTLVTLVVIIVIMSILAATSITFGLHTIDSMQLQNFSYELEQIQGRVDTIYEKIKLGDESYKQIGENANFSTKAVSTLKNLGISDISNYQYLTPKDLEEDLNIENSDQSVVINFKTKDVISVDGFKYKDTTYYRLKDI